MKLDLKGFQGYVKKTATIVSDDPAHPRVVVSVEGKVEPLIRISPEKSVSFFGTAETVKESVVDLVATSKAFHIRSLDDTLEKKAVYKLETVEEGRRYRLRISNNTKHGNYRGHITLHTDSAEKPELTIWVNGSIEGQIAVRPKTLVVGRLSPDQGVLSGKVQVTNNLNGKFRIVKCSYDERVINVIQSTMPDGSGFSLEVTPNMQNIPAGGRLQTTLTIETDVDSDAKQEVQVQAINLGAKPK